MYLIIFFLTLCETFIAIYCNDDVNLKDSEDDEISGAASLAIILSCSVGVALFGYFVSYLLIRAIRKYQLSKLEEEFSMGQLSTMGLGTMQSSSNVYR